MPRRTLPIWILLALPALVMAQPPAGPSTPRPVLDLAGIRYHPLDGDPPRPAWFVSSAHLTSAKGLRYPVALTRSPITAEQRRRLESLGAEILDYIPTNGYRLRAPAAAIDALGALPFVAWLGDLPGPMKISPALRSLAGRGAPESRVRVILGAGEPPDRVTRILEGLAPRAAPSGKDGAWRVEATLTPGRLAADLSRLAGLPEVEYVEPVRPARYLNQDAVWIHQSFVGPSPQQTPVFDQGIFGCGQTIAVSDSGQDHDACYFRDGVAGPPPVFLCSAAPCPAGTPAPSRRKDVIYYNWSGGPTGDDDLCPGFFGASGHGTHTSGSAAGDGSPFADCSGFTTAGRNGGDGQAPGAKLVLQEMGDGLEYLNALGGTLWNLSDVAFASGARIHSNSWGTACHDSLGQCIDGCVLEYDSFARDADLAMWTYPDLLLVFSAGNAGDFCPPPNSVGSPALAKSPIAAGAVGHGSSADTVPSFSSPGPTLDGRLKPTVAAQGEAVVSAASDANPASNNCSTCSLDGTSMSAPTTAGLAALVREYYTSGFLSSGTRNPAAGFVPTAALVKATLIDGAVAPGPAGVSPDFSSGYGRVLLGATLPFAGAPFQLRVDDHREGIATGSVVTHAYDVAGGMPLRATLVWTDRPAALGASPTRVNELELEVIDPAGAVWFQTIDAATGAPAPTSNPADPHDGVNVEERLVFDTPAAGRWVVRVTGVNVLLGPQPFALLVRGALTDCPAPAAPGAPTLTTPADHQVNVSWNSVPAAVAYDVYRSFGSCPGGPWVPVATAVTGTSYLDTGVSGGVAYSYHVTASTDPAAHCESARSPCASVVPTGDCLLAPEFGGVVAAASAGASGCSIDLRWEEAAARCVGDVRYNVYRDTTSGFIPSAATRIARCLTGTSYTDAADLVHGVTYYYVVRAEDATTGHGGPCRGGNEETNMVLTAASPDGPLTPGTWTDDAGDTGQATLQTGSPWTVSPTGGNAGPRVYTANSFEGACADLTSPVLTLDTPALGPQLFFATADNLEYDPNGIFASEGSLGQVEIATGPGFTNWTRVPLTPDYPTPVDFPINNCATTQNPATYFSGGDLTWSVHSASLANWAGGQVRIRFHLSGDLLYPTGSWRIDDLQVTHALVPGACTTLTSAPPPIPDGATVPGQPLDVMLAGGGEVTLSWDATSCPAAAVNVYYGALGGYSAFTGGFCDLPGNGSATLPLPDGSWFLVVATDGASTDGSWSRDGLGNELLYGGSGTVCPAITGHATTGGCP